MTLHDRRVDHVAWGWQRFKAVDEAMSEAIAAPIMQGVGPLATEEKGPLGRISTEVERVVPLAERDAKHAED